MRPGHVRWKSLRKYLGWATQSTAAKAANQQDQFHLPAMRRKIGRPPAVPAVKMARSRAAARARRRGFVGTRVDPDRVPNKLNLVGLETCWQEIPP